MMTIDYVQGDATRPRGLGPKIIAHVCNDIGAWGAGFVIALGARFPLARGVYQEWINEAQPASRLGENCYLFIEQENTVIANMVAQQGVGRHNGPPIRYEALKTCLLDLRKAIDEARQEEGKVFSLHMPRIGCGLAGGSWDKVEPLIQEAFEGSDYAITVYDLPGRPFVR